MKATIGALTNFDDVNFSKSHSSNHDAGFPSMQKRRSTHSKRKHTTSHSSVAPGEVSVNQHETPATTASTVSSIANPYSAAICSSSHAATLQHYPKSSNNSTFRRLLLRDDVNLDVDYDATLAFPSNSKNELTEVIQKRDKIKSKINKITKQNFVCTKDESDEMLNIALREQHKFHRDKNAHHQLPCRVASCTYRHDVLCSTVGTDEKINS